MSAWVQAPGAPRRTECCKLGLSVSTGARPRLLVALSLALIPAFAVAVVTKGYRAEQRRLGAEWFERGSAALEGGQPDEAIEAFRTALTFSREDRLFRLRLAQALAADGRVAEARAYLLTLRDSQPGNGPVNLELARLAAKSGDPGAAHRYYHASIEGAWNDTAEVQRRSSSRKSSAHGAPSRWVPSCWRRCRALWCSTCSSAISPSSGCLSIISSTRQLVGVIAIDDILASYRKLGS
jgi:tetratricopeptide (TPR) repeat protein